jgi:hypothetical protein
MDTTKEVLEKSNVAKHYDWKPFTKKDELKHIKWGAVKWGLAIIVPDTTEWKIPTHSKEFTLQWFFENHLPVAHEHLKPFLGDYTWMCVWYEMEHPLESPAVWSPQSYEYEERIRSERIRSKRLKW